MTSNRQIILALLVLLTCSSCDKYIHKELDWQKWYKKEKTILISYLPIYRYDFCCGILDEYNNVEMIKYDDNPSIQYDDFVIYSKALCDNISSQYPSKFKTIMGDAIWDYYCQKADFQYIWENQNPSKLTRFSDGRCYSWTIKSEAPMFGREAGADISDKFNFVGHNEDIFIFDKNHELKGLITPETTIKEYLSYEPLLIFSGHLRFNEKACDAPTQTRLFISIDFSKNDETSIHTINDTLSVNLLP